MNCFPTRLAPTPRSHGFSLVEMLVVVAIISILMTAGSIGLSNIGGRGVTSGVDTVEALVDEARTLAIGKNIRTALLVARELTNNPTEDRRRILVAHEELDDDENPITPANQPPNWVLTSRGALLPDQTFYSEAFSKKNHEAGSGEIDHIAHAKIVDAKFSYQGTYYCYGFNAQGMPIDVDGNAIAGASFVIGTGSRLLTQPATTRPPKVVGSARRDFGGFVIWRNGRTSVFRSPDQISPQMKSITVGTSF